MPQRLNCINHYIYKRRKYKFYAVLNVGECAIDTATWNASILFSGFTNNNNNNAGIIVMYVDL